MADTYHDSDRAIRLTRDAHDAMRKSHWEKAEKLLREALAADVNYGPAHNTLGWLYFQQEQLYLAAWEFEYAARLMPELSEPLNNQALVLEAAGRFEEAAALYEQALSMAPQHPEAYANLGRCLVRLDDLGTGEQLRTAELLREVALRDERPEWREWARELLDTRYVEQNVILASGTCWPGEIESLPMHDGAGDAEWPPSPMLPTPAEPPGFGAFESLPMPIIEDEAADFAAQPVPGQGGVGSQRPNRDDSSVPESERDPGGLFEFLAE